MLLLLVLLLADDEVNEDSRIRIGIFVGSSESLDGTIRFSMINSSSSRAVIWVFLGLVMDVIWIIYSSNVR